MMWGLLILWSFVGLWFASRVPDEELDKWGLGEYLMNLIAHGPFVWILALVEFIMINLSGDDEDDSNSEE